MVPRRGLVITVTIIGPWLAGHLSQHISISAPFFVSGLLLILTALALLPLRLAPRTQPQ